MTLIPGICFGQADVKGFYLGASLGQIEATEWCSTSDAPAGFTVPSCDDKATAGKLFAGYRFHPNFALEGTYLKSNDFTGTVTFGGVSADVKADLQGFGLAAVGIWPLGERFSLFGKLGFMRTEAEGTVTVGGSTITLGDNDTEAHYGFGAGYNFSANWGVRAEWERLDKNNLDMLSIGVQYKF